MKKFISSTVVFVSIGISLLWPNLSYAFFAEAFSGIGSSLLAAGQTSSFALTSFGSTLDRASESILTAVEDITENIKSHVSSVAQSAKEAINPVESLRELYGVKNTALSLVNYESGIMNYGKNNTRNAMIHDSSFMFDNPPSFAQETTQVGASLPRLAERIIERILVKEVNQESRIMNQGTNDNSNTSMIHDSSFMIQDPRINSLITNVADLTSRLDEKDGSPYRNSALFNMIAQSQRIKTLDDVKITNATIEGYATSKGVSDSLATYLPLGGGHTHGRSHRNLSYALYHP